jgi:hypothetical protein
MNQRRLLIWGLVLTILGILTCSYLRAIAWLANWDAFFDYLSSENRPLKTYQNFRCPMFMNLGRSAMISATFRNSTSYTINYSIDMIADGFRIDSCSGTNVAVPSGEVARVDCTVTANENGAQVVTLWAISNIDVPDYSSPFYSYPTSVGGACSVLVFTGPLGGSEMFFLGLVISIVGGALLVTWYISKMKQRRAQR